MMKVQFIRDVEQPEFLRGKIGEVREIEQSHALRLWLDGYVELPEPPAGFGHISERGQAVAAASKPPTPAKNDGAGKKPAAPTT